MSKIIKSLIHKEVPAQLNSIGPYRRSSRLKPKSVCELTENMEKRKDASLRIIDENKHHENLQDDKKILKRKVMPKKSRLRVQSKFDKTSEETYDLLAPEIAYQYCSTNLYRIDGSEKTFTNESDYLPMNKSKLNAISQNPSALPVKRKGQKQSKRKRKNSRTETNINIDCSINVKRPQKKNPTATMNDFFSNVHQTTCLINNCERKSMNASEIAELLRMEVMAPKLTPLKADANVYRDSQTSKAKVNQATTIIPRDSEDLYINATTLPEPCQVFNTFNTFPSSLPNRYPLHLVHQPKKTALSCGYLSSDEDNNSKRASSNFLCDEWDIGTYDSDIPEMLPTITSLCTEEGNKNPYLISEEQLELISLLLNVSYETVVTVVKKVLTVGKEELLIMRNYIGFFNEHIPAENSEYLVKKEAIFSDDESSISSMIAGTPLSKRTRRVTAKNIM